MPRSDVRLCCVYDSQQIVSLFGRKLDSLRGVPTPFLS
jgi:hypothetical protein